MTNAFEEYADLKREIAAKEARLKELQPLIIAAMVEQNIESLDSNSMNFSFRKAKKWTYPQAVTDLQNFIAEMLEPFEAKLAGKKKEAELNGEAKCEITQTLVCKSI